MASEMTLSSTEDLLRLVSLVHDHFEQTQKPLRIKITTQGSRTLSQNALAHLLYGQISSYLIGKGKSQCSPEWVKESLKSKFLGWIKKDFTDIHTGEITSMLVIKPSSELDRGEYHYYLTQIIDWAESIGFEPIIPENSEFRQIEKEQCE